MPTLPHSDSFDRRVLRSIKLRWVVCILLSLASVERAEAACNKMVNLSGPVRQFQIYKASRIQALLEFGKENDICFGIEYANRRLLTELSDFRVENSTVQGAIETILGASPVLTIRLRKGIVEIVRKTGSRNHTGVFDVVLPKWEAPRRPIQWVALNLYMALKLAQDPKIKGFGGDIFGGDLNNEVGPFHECNRTIRYFLDEMVMQSRGGSWITQAPWDAPENYYVVGGRLSWTIVEYGETKSDFSWLLRAMAENFP